MTSQPFGAIGGALRAGRRHADLSQRDLAARAGVSAATVARAELGDRGVGVGVLQDLLGHLGLVLMCVHAEDAHLLPAPDDSVRDRAGRRFPPHLDVRPVGDWGTWWGDFHCVDLPERNPARPQYTFEVSRWRRNYRRTRQRTRDEARGASTADAREPPR